MILKHFKSKKGMTLTESIISLGLLSLIAVFVVTAFLVNYRSIAIEGENKVGDKKALSGVEQAIGKVQIDNSVANVTDTNGSFIIIFGSETFSIDGSYINSSDVDGSSSFKYFKPGD